MIYPWPMATDISDHGCSYDRENSPPNSSTIPSIRRQMYMCMFVCKHEAAYTRM